MMEETEYAFLRSRGLSVVMHDERGIMGFPRIKSKLNVTQPLIFEQEVYVRLNLTELDGKQLQYQFEIVDQSGEIWVTGTFDIACCRFPNDQPPFAVLIPGHVEAALAGSPHSNNLVTKDV